MQLPTTALVTFLLAGAASARVFTIYEHSNYAGVAHTESLPDGPVCWNLNGKGDRGSSVAGGAGCTTFYRQVIYLF